MPLMVAVHFLAKTPQKWTVLPAMLHVMWLKTSSQLVLRLTARFLSYAIGVAQPVSIHVETFGTGKLSDERFEALVREHFELRPAGIIHTLDLRRPIYRQTAAFGHFGRPELDLPWERTDKAEALRAAV